MKYLKNREHYLSEINTGLKEYRSTGDISKLEAINEVLSNDIAWGDSLLGRLINSIIRKAKIGFNLVKMQSVINALKGCFDQLVADGVMMDMGSESHLKLSRYIIFMLLKELELSASKVDDFIINDGSEKADKPENLKEIKDLVDSAIKIVDERTNELVEGYKEKLSPKQIDILQKDRDDIIKALKLFRESLNKIEPDKVDDDEKVEKKEEVTVDIKNIMVDNFKSVYGILYEYNLAKKSAGASHSASGTSNSSNAMGVSHSNIQPDNFKDKKLVNKKVNKDNQSYQFIFEQLQSSPELAKSIKPMYDFFIQTGQFKFDNTELKGLGNDSGWKNLYREKSMSLYKIYNTVRVLSKLPKIEVKANENIDNILGKADTTGKFIFNLYNVTKAKADGGFDGISDNMKSNISKFNSTMKSILSVSVDDKKTDEVSDNGVEVGKTYKYTNKEGETKDVLVVDKDKVVRPGDDKKFLTNDDKKTDDLESKEMVSVATNKSNVTFAVNKDNLKKESMLYRYSDFIKEANEEDTWYTKVNEFWKSVFLANCDLGKYKLADDQVVELMEEVNGLEKNAKFIKIDGMDPVMEIVRLFNRAYRLHTTTVIPSGRSDGRVSNKTFREYDFVGGGSDSAKPSAAGTIEPGTGPYRNVALFGKWEDAVRNDILGDDKYRVIFNKGTTIQVGDGDPVVDFGKILLKFMNALLDGNKMYTEGEQKKFISEYFKTNDISSDKFEFPKTGDVKVNNENAPKVKETTVDFVKEDLKSIKKGQILKVNYVDADGRKISKYIYIYSAKDNKYYVKFADSVSFIKSYLPTTTIFKNPISSKGSGTVYFSKLKDTKLKKGGVYEFEALDVSSFVKGKYKITPIKLTISEIFILKNEDGSIFELDKPTNISRGDTNKDMIQVYNSEIAKNAKK